MRLWSIHPRYLDSKGLVALWREALLARAVLKGRTRCYTHHPQLVRFQRSPDPLAAIEYYLHPVFDEAQQRGFAFDPSKLIAGSTCPPIPVTAGQLHYELEHLRSKLKKRDLGRLEQIKTVEMPEPHPLFRVVSGEMEPWEKVI